MGKKTALSGFNPQKGEGEKKAKRVVHFLPHQIMLEFSSGERVNMDKNCLSGQGQSLSTSW